MTTLNSRSSRHQASCALYWLAKRQTSPCGISWKRWRKVASREAFNAPIGFDRSLYIETASHQGKAASSVQATGLFTHSPTCACCRAVRPRSHAYMQVKSKHTCRKQDPSDPAAQTCSLQDPWKHRPLRQVVNERPAARFRKSR